MRSKQRKNFKATAREVRLRQMYRLRKLGKRTIGFMLFFNILIMSMVFFSVSGALFISEQINALLDRTVGFTTPWFQVLFSLVIGFALTFIIGWVIFTPIKRLQAAMDAVADGDFDASVPNRSHIREIESINQSFDVMAKELRATEILQSDFVSNVSHEFKTPLNAIEGYATLLEDPTLTEEERTEYLEKIRFNSQRMSTLVGNILLISKVDTQAIEGQKALYRLDEQVRQALLLHESRWTEKEIEFEVHLEEIEYYGNEGLMLHVWSNLLGNAVKFAPTCGWVAMTLTRSAKEILFTIEDNGPGIAEDALKHIYDKFYQSDASHREEGNGLGLALVKKILDTAGGSIEAENRAEGGCRFAVRLPMIG